MKRKLLVVVDMQNDFIDGSLGTKEAVALVPKLAKYIRDFDGYVIATQDTHGENYLKTLEGNKLPIEHCIVKTYGWEINREIDEALESKGTDVLAYCMKPTFGSFELIDEVANELKNIDGIEVCGLCTGICVLSNACLLRAAYPDLPITVNAEYTECVSPEAKKVALSAMKLIQIDVIGE